MAYLREYLLDEEKNMVVKYFFIHHSDVVPSMVIRLNYKSFDLSVSVRSYSVQCQPFLITDEIFKLFELIDRPFWKSYCRTCSFEHRFKQQDLFSDL